MSPMRWIELSALAALALAIAGCGGGEVAADGGGDGTLDAAARDAAAPPDGGPSRDAGECAPLTNDTAPRGQECGSSADCPSPYVCQSFVGIVLMQSCQLLCSRDCQCPAGHRCASHADKEGTWMQCDPIDP